MSRWQLKMRVDKAAAEGTDLVADMVAVDDATSWSPGTGSMQ